MFWRRRAQPGDEPEGTSEEPLHSPDPALAPAEPPSMTVARPRREPAGMGLRSRPSGFGARLRSILSGDATATDATWDEVEEALIAADVWRTMPFVALLCYARVLTIPGEVYEAALVDGAGRLATLRDITLPLLRRVLLIALLFRTLDALRAFDLMFVLTGGGPASTTETLTVYAYRSLFQTLQLGFGAAVGVVVFVLVMLVAGLYLRALRRAEAAT